MTNIQPKPIHGDPVPLWRRFGLQELPPELCPFHVGDRVVFTNEYGLKFDMDIIGFSKDAEFYGRFIHLVRHGADGYVGAWWFPHKPSEISVYDPSHVAGC